MKTLICAALLVTSAAQAQALRNRVEKAQDRKALRQNRQEHREDLRDTGRLAGLIARFDAARQRNDVAALGLIENEVRGFVNAELFENAVEVARDAKEVAQSKSELRSDRRELKQDVTLARRPGVKADDRRDLRDDRRDLRDDKKDLAVELGQGARVRRVDDELAALLGKADAASLDRKRALYAELLQIQKNELAQNAGERVEDRKELREDRKETREDRRDPVR